MSLRIDIGDMDIDSWEALHAQSKNYCEENRIKTKVVSAMDISRSQI